MSPTKSPKDFRDIQRSEWRISLFLFLLLFPFYFLFIGLIGFAALWGSGLFIFNTTEFIFAASFWFKAVGVILFVSLFIAFFHLYDARKYGAKYILERLQATSPDKRDRYHIQFANLVDEIRIATGLPRVRSYILPSFAINSMAVMESDGTPAVLVTEGMLADATRDELQSVVAHELAHIVRGDTVFITLVCSLANILEKIRQVAEPEKERGSLRYAGTRGEGNVFASQALIYIVALISSLVMTLLSTLISRRREYLADALAVEFIRNPKALARIIYKSHLKYSFVGDFNQTYAPLFIVDPLSSSESEGFFSNLFSTHPPMKKRMETLSRMAGTHISSIMEEVWDLQKNRDKSRGILQTFEETMKGVELPPLLEEESLVPLGGEKIWHIRDSRGKWQGPFGLGDLLVLPFFTPMIRIRNTTNYLEAPAREHLEIREAMGSLSNLGKSGSTGKNKCFHCNAPLSDSEYEGVPVKNCQRCGGKLVEMETINRILSRKEKGFSESLRQKAEKFKNNILLNPLKTQKYGQEAPHSPFCPNCGNKMMTRPYSYQYFVPVEKCLNCSKIWFDADELEILQILVESQ